MLNSNGKGRFGISMRIRLLGFLVMMVIAMLVFVVMILALTGVLETGQKEAERSIRQEFSYLTQDVEKLYGDTSVQAVILSESLSSSIENNLMERGLSAKELPLHPDQLEELLSAELTQLLLALEKTRCSGVFVALDATVNPALPGALHSKAGIYLRNTEPNVVSTDAAKLYLRGFPRIALENNLSLQSKWDMEFDVKGKAYFHDPIRAYKEGTRELSRLYCWSYEEAVSGLGEPVMLCSIPLISSDGAPIGVCGFEISQMNFRLQFAPGEDPAGQAAFMILPEEEDGFDASSALFAGASSAFVREKLLFAGDMKGLHQYRQGSVLFAGVSGPVKLYPEDSPFADRKSAAALLFPKEPLEKTVAGYNNRIALICAAMLLLGILLAYFISRRYVKPIIKGMNALRSEETLNDEFRMNIPEMDELIALIKEKQAQKSASQAGSPDDGTDDFLRRIESLTPTERGVFDLYVKGCTAGEIADKMYISINTVKTHSRRIYAKMGVNSRSELLAYCIGLTGKIKTPSA